MLHSPPDRRIPCTCLYHRHTYVVPFSPTVQAAGYAAADSVQALPLVSTIWGVVLFGEYFRWAPQHPCLVVVLDAKCFHAISVLHNLYPCAGAELVRRLSLQVVKADVCPPGLHADHVCCGCWFAHGFCGASLLRPLGARHASWGFGKQPFLRECAEVVQLHRLYSISVSQSRFCACVSGQL